jgi:hypothetical protein
MQQKILTFILLFGLCALSFAQGDLLITPTRLVFEGRIQKQQAYLVNTGKETATYSISFLQYNQTEEGGYTVIENSDSEQLFAETYLRVYPRTVTLEPSESQVLALYFKRNAAMQDGEYRSHLYLRSENDYTPLGQENKDSLKTISVKLIPIYGVSIPVIIRKGALSVDVTLNDLKLTSIPNEPQSLKLSIQRTGNMSTNGNIIVNYIDENNKTYEVGKMKSVAVYTNLTKRNVSIKLNQNPEVTINKGKLEVRYIATDASSKEKEVYAMAELVL